jgi:transcriptional regulator GlxA family with amidase domain
MCSAQTTSTYLERHLTVADLASLWNLSEDTIRRLFLDEPGVVTIRRSRRRARVYRSIRIPESVARRVHERLTIGESHGR